MVMDVTINTGLCAYRLLPWKWEMVAVNNCEPQWRWSLHATNQKLHEKPSDLVTAAQLSHTCLCPEHNGCPDNGNTFKKSHNFIRIERNVKYYDSTSSPVRSWKRSLLIAFPAVVVYFCRSVFWIHLYSCAAVNLQANRTHAVTTDSFPLTSRTGE